MTVPAAYEDPALVAAARHGIVSPAQTVEVNPADIDRVVGRARFDRSSGFLARALADGVVGGPPDLTERVTAAWREELRAVVRLEGVIVRTTETLAGAGLRYRLTKGAALAQLDYPDVAVRTFGDVDLVIHPADWGRTVEVLGSAGCTRAFTTLPYAYDNRYGKGATLKSPDGFELDLHRRFAIGRFGVSSRMEDVFADLSHIELAGHRIATMVPEHRLLHACYHATLGGFRRLRAFRDVAQLLVQTRADLEATFAIANRWRAAAVVTAAVTETWQRLRLAPELPLPDLVVAHPIRCADRRALEVFAQARPFRTQALTALGRLGPVDSARYLYSLSNNRLRARRS